MKNAIILHGMLDKEEYLDEANLRPEESHFLPWIKNKLTENGITAYVPAFPIPYAPDYQSWKEVFEKFEITSETILIGHSGGGGFLLRWLSENKVRVGKVLLVAPWIDPNKTLDSYFDFEMDEDLASRTDGVIMYFSTDDEADILESVKQIKGRLKNITTKEFDDRGHFTIEDMGTVEFPELLEVVL